MPPMEWEVHECNQSLVGRIVYVCVDRKAHDRAVRKSSASWRSSAHAQILRPGIGSPTSLQRMTKVLELNCICCFYRACSDTCTWSGISFKPTAHDQSLVKITHQLFPVRLLLYFTLIGTKPEVSALAPILRKRLLLLSFNYVRQKTCKVYAISQDYCACSRALSEIRGKFLNISHEARLKSQWQPH